MTYEEKFNLVVNAIREAIKARRNGQPVKLYYTDDNGLTHFLKDEVHDILVQLQDEKIIAIQHKINRLLPIEKQPVDANYIFLDILEGFEPWYEQYLMKQKTNLENLTAINLLRILDTAQDINEQIQLTNQTTVYINLLPSLIRYRQLFPADTIGFRDEYCEHRLDSLKYLKEKEIITDYSHGRNGWDTAVTISLVLSTFDEFYKKIKEEYIKRNKENEKKTDVILDKSPTTQASNKVNYDAKTGNLNIEGKIVKLNKDSFRAKIIELLLNDEKSRKKEWSWDEVIEKIQGVSSADELQENKNKFYPACDGLSKFIAQKIGTNDLLTFNKSSVRINTKYL